MTDAVPAASRGFYEASGLEVGKELRSAQLRLREFTTRGMVRLPAHRHESAHLCLLVRGAMRCSCGREAYVPWIAVFHPPGTEHRCELSHARAVTLEIGKPWLHLLRRHAVEPATTVTLEPQSQWLAMRLVREFKNLRPASLLVIEGLTAQLLAATVRSTIDPRGQQTFWLEELLQRLGEDFGHKHQLHELAASLNVHPVRLSRAFREATGRTLHEHLRDLRVQYLARRLAGGDEPLVELSLQAGFYDQSHCTREFKRVTGMTPAAYRRLLRARASGQ